MAEGDERKQSNDSSEIVSGDDSSEASTPKESAEGDAPLTGSDTAVVAGARPRGRRGGEAGRTRPVTQSDVKTSIACTIYICDLHLQITEEMLANCFKSCGVVTDVRVCGDCNQDLRFAFLEFSSKDSVEQALALNGQSVAGYPLRISRSKTAIMPVNTSFLPRSSEEREQCSRTIYVSNLDRQVDRSQLMAWFHKFAGPISAIRMKNDMYNNTRIAFIEFASAADAQRALRECSGALLGMLPVRISPSKTPVRADQRNRN